MEITDDNWTFSHYKFADKRAFISFGASPEILDIQFQYFVTVIDEDENEVFQEEFAELNAACHSINKKYNSIADYIDMKKPSGGGCGSCSAH